MTEKLGKIEKPPVADFIKGRKLFFVPVVYPGESLPDDFLAIFKRYWEQAAKQLGELSLKLGDINAVYHEMIDLPGEEGAAALQELDSAGYEIVKTCLEKKARLEALEDPELLTEFMDWSRCLMTGLQNPRVITKVYESYIAAGKQRTEAITKKLDTSLRENEIGILLMRENHQVQFPADIQVFYVSPPALDEIKRWVREQERAAKDTKPAV